MTKKKSIKEILTLFLNYWMEMTQNNVEKKIAIDENYSQIYSQFFDSLEMAETDFSDYLSNLEDYEEKLANGEIKW